MKAKYVQYIKYMADFETYAPDDNTTERTWVWGGTIVPVFTDPDRYSEEDVVYFNSIERFFELLEINSRNKNMQIFFHNLKFDGAFILDWLLRNPAYTPGMTGNTFKDDEDMQDHEYKYLISDMGQWYHIKIKLGKHFIFICDSLKLLPFKVSQIGESFSTRHKKLDLEYKGLRLPGYTPTPEEMRYMKNDVLVVAEALSIFFSEGHKNITIGSNCLSEYKTIMHKDHMIQWKKYFPNLQEIELPETYGSPNAESYIRKSYRGGWCYLVKGKEDRIYHDGCTFDVNSLYPSCMHSDSGNLYPVGKPVFWSGDYIPKAAEGATKYYFIRFRCTFRIKPKKLPFVQVKGDILYDATEMLTESAVYYQGSRFENELTLTMTQTDFELFREHYNVKITILDGCYFDGIRGIFDMYINKYAKIKQESKGAVRQIAKLFLNNLYGQMAKSPNSSYKIAYLEEGRVRFRTIEEHKKKVVYIPIGSAITSYARNFTIRAAQENYRHFIYADTDSIHLDCPPQEVKGIKIDDKAFQCWALESEWTEGIFHRQKTYIEREAGGYNIKCAGMPQASKKIFSDGLEAGSYVLTDFREGLELAGKLLPHRCEGGIILRDTTFLMRD